MILSLADGSFQKSESNIILDFLEKNYKENIDLIKEQAFLGALPHEEHLNHLQEIAAQFYSISNQKERDGLIKFAMKVVMADKKMDKSENKFIHALFDAWGIE